MNGVRKTAGTPIWETREPRTSRRGDFWIPGERMELDGATYQRGPMYVAWEAPPGPAGRPPVVLVHGGTLQSTQWGDTPDGRPGWAQRFVEAGYPVFVVDRAAQGRSPFHPDVVGQMGGPFPYEEARHVYFPAEIGRAHTEWPFADDDQEAIDRFVAPFNPLPADLAASQQMDADRLGALLDMTGPAVLLTHSASGPDGWLAADRRPGGVLAIVTIEPMGPPFAEIPHIGALSWGITAAPITYDPPRRSAAEVRAADPSTLRIPSLARVPVAVVTTGASPFREVGPPITEALRIAGAAAEHLALPDHGVTGNGHGVMFERNSDAALAPILDWLRTRLSGGTATRTS